MTEETWLWPMMQRSKGCLSFQLQNVIKFLDRTRGNVTLDAKNGHGTLFTMEEEKMLVDHLSYMADIGYGYQKSKVQYMARDFAAVLGKDIKNQEYLSNCWFYGFIGRWPEMKVVKPQKLTIFRAKSASSEVLGKYYQELGTILKSNNLLNKPERIWNIDETGVPTEHSRPKIVCNIGTNPQAVTSPRGSTITVIVIYLMSVYYRNLTCFNR